MKTLTPLQAAAWERPFIDDSKFREPPIAWRFRHWRVGLSLNK